MRMWIGISPTMLCSRHLLGEHYEIHKAVGCILKDKSLVGWTSRGFLEVHNIPSRHFDIATEMERRGYKHKSPLPDCKFYWEGKASVLENTDELKYRCVDCKKIMEGRNVFI